MSENSQSAQRSRAWIVAAIAFVPFVVLAWRFRWSCDDAFISFRYSRHLGEGLGLRFNAGEAPPVEGFSNLLWVLVLAPFAKLGLELGSVAQALSIACGAALIVLIARFVERELELGFAGKLCTALVFATLPTSAIWATSGLETMAFSLALFAAFAKWRESTLAAALCACAAVLLRADGFVWVAVVLAVAWLSERKSASELVRCAAIVGGVVAANFVARKLYFGDWLPNTAHAKVGATSLRLERGFDYLATMALTVPALVLVPLAALCGLRSAAKLFVSALAVLAFACTWSIYLGGDFMAMGRLFVPATPFVALLFAVAWRGLWSRARALPFVAAIIALALSTATLSGARLVPDAWLQRFHFRWNRPDAISELAQWRQMRQRAEQWDIAARAIALHTRAGESMVIDAIGVVGYRTELELFDILGLVSPEVTLRGATPGRASPGHDLRVEPEFFLERKPDFMGASIVPSNAPEFAGLPSDWRSRPWAPRVRVERFALDPRNGFPAQCELRLFRLDWSKD